MSATEKLIILVKPHPCLYNTKEKEYRNTMKKELLWKKISKELNQSRDEIKVKWKNLKDGYTKHKKSLKCTTGRKKAYNNWVWAPYLQFLDDIIEPRATTSNITRPLTPSQSPLSTRSDISDPLEMSPSSKDTPPMEIPPRQMSPTSSSKKRTFDDQDGVEKIIEYLKCKKNKPDAVDHLFASYAETFKNLKPRTQASVKLKLAEIFVEAELSDLYSENQQTEVKQSPVYDP